MSTATARAPAADFLSDGGEMGRLMREYDWSSTPLGEPDTWPQSLRTSVSTCLNCAFPILIWWGSELAKLYNDAYVPMLGTKHPAALGAPGQQVWPEIWNRVGPMLNGVMTQGSATRAEDLFLPLHRRGYTEECYFSFSYSPIRDESGGVGGVFCPVIETTERVIGERRLLLLRRLAEQTNNASTPAKACAAAAACLAAGASHDLPFVAFYLLSGESAETAELAGAAGIQPGNAVCPETIHLADKVGVASPLSADRARGDVQSVEAMFATSGELPRGAWDSPPERVVVLPLGSGSTRPFGFMVAGLNPYRPAEDVRGFADLVAGQVATVIGNALAYEAERRRAEALAEIDRAKTAFFANVSHEFRTPLTLMLGPLEESLAESGTLPAAERERVQVAHRNGLRLLKLVNSLLDFSRIEAGRVEAVFGPVDLAALTADLASCFRSAIEKAGLELVVECPPLSQPVWVDREMWEKVLLNLLSNAFKFTFAGRITVRVHDRGGAAEIIVQDTGTGIPEAEMPRLFERFHRIEGARGRSLEGSGIGLALVQELLRIQGGTVRVDSDEGAGAAFIITLPFGTAHLPPDRVREKSAGASTAVRAQAFVEEAMRWLPEATGTAEPLRSSHLPPEPGMVTSAAGRRPRVLVADDNADMRRYVSRLLSTGCEIETVSDGRAALAAIRTNAPDLILTDVMMPGLDGFGLVRTIRATPGLRDIPVIVLSARAGEEASVEGLDAGADDYLVKPFSAAELRARVRANLTLARVRNDATRSLSDSEKRFRAAVDAVEGILWTNNAAGEMEGHQASWSALTGQAYDEYQGFGWANAVHPDDAQPTIDAWNAAVADRRPFVFEHRVRRHDGAWRTFAIRAIPTLAEDGSIREWVGVHTDITARRAAEAEQARLAAVVEQSGDLIGFATLDGRLSFLNDAGRHLVGLADLDAVRGRPIAEFLAGRTQSTLASQLLPAVEREGYWSGELDFRHFGTGATFPTFCSIFLVRNATGTPIGYGTVTRDLTEQKQTEAALRASEARLKAIFDTVPVGIMIGEAPSGRIVDGNRQVEAIVGHPIIFSPDVEAYSAYVSYHADGREVAAHEYPLARAIAGEERPELEALYRRGDGRETWIRFIAAPIRSAGRITGGIVASLDIDREKRAIEALDRTREELEARVERAVREREAAQAGLAHAQRMEALGQLAGGIAHDFNNVLQAVAGGLGLIQKRADDPQDVRKIARMAADAASRGASVTARLLAFARKGELRAVPVSVPGLLQDLREILTSTLGAGIAVRVGAPPGGLPLLADKAQLETVMVNLAVNARDAMPAGGTLTLAALPEAVIDSATHPAGLRPGAYVRFEMTDTGIGMDAATLARAPEPFFTTKGPGQGTGLGLAMARGFAQQSDGGFTLASAPGRGTTVTLWFPQASALWCHAEPTHTAVPNSLLGAARVLIVDDDRLVREMLARELTESGFETSHASDGLSALARLDRGERVDLLITDLSMPGMNGMVLAQEARLRRASLPVMLLTGYADTSLGGDLDLLQDSGVMMLRKPIVGQELVRQATSLLLAHADQASAHVSA